MFEAREVTWEKKRFALIGSQHFVDTVTKQQPMIEDGDSCVLGGGNYAIDVDVGRHSSNARSQRRRCFSVFAVRRGISTGGRRPKLMFIGAKCFCGVETYRHKAPIAVSAGMIIGSSSRRCRTALMPATRPDATFSM